MRISKSVLQLMKGIPTSEVLCWNAETEAVSGYSCVQANSTCKVWQLQTSTQWERRHHCLTVYSSNGKAEFVISTLAVEALSEYQKQSM